MAERPTSLGNTLRPEKTGEHSKPRGKLKIFFSYAPGTGKTLAMLEDAYRRQQEGVDVVVGYVDAHSELLAMQLLERFRVLPQQHILDAFGVSYSGLDLNALLRQRPELVVVDHLARAVPPGQRHESRYLEVDELLNAGINVYTTLNIYQLESQVDAVAYLTGVVVHETVPDRFMDEVDQLEMVDLPPQELLERYTAGKVFIQPRAQAQMEKFFQPGNLFALRELTLRHVARRSNAFMRQYLKKQGLPSNDASSIRLLVCISDSANGGRLVRSGRRMADETRAEWTVVHVETPDQLDRSDNARQAVVTQNMRLAELLGAHVETLTGRTVAEAVSEYARRNHLHRIMIGRSPSRTWFNTLGAPLAEQLLRDDPTLNVFVVGSDYKPRPFQMPRFWTRLSGAQFLNSLLLAMIPTALGLMLSPGVISRSANLVMLYLVAISLSSFFLGIIPSLLTAVLSVLAFDFFFVPPTYRFFGFAPEYAITFFSMLLISLVISILATRERSVTRAAQRRAEQVTQLYELSHDLAVAVDMTEILDTVLRHVRETFDRQTVILLPKDGQLALSASNAAKALDSSELTAAEWAWQQGRPAGYNTGTFSYASYRYFPLETSRGIIGVMGVCLADGKPELHPEQMRQLGAYVTKAASSIERALFAEEASQTEILRATEKLQTALLNSISHDLRTPLASITGVLDSLRMSDAMLDSETRHELVETAFGEAERLNRLVGNLLDMSRLESGTLRISRQPCDVQDLVGAALNAASSRLDGHPVKVDIPADLPLVPLDFVLINQVLINLLDNAAKYSPESGPIEVAALRSGEAVRMEIRDHGPGIPAEDLERIFEKFYRVKRFEHVVGTGLGLSICKGIVEVHGGKIWAENRPEGGVCMAFTLPLKSPLMAVLETNDEMLPEEMQA